MSNESTMWSELFRRWPASRVTVKRNLEPLAHFAITLEAIGEHEVIIGRATGSGVTRVAALREVIALLTPVPKKPRAPRLSPVDEDAEQRESA